MSLEEHWAAESGALGELLARALPLLPGVRSRESWCPQGGPDSKRNPKFEGALSHQSRTPPHSPHTKMTDNKEWSTHFCWPCGIKDAGLTPCCCPNFLCPCMPMMWASAMTQIKGKEYDYVTCCLAAQCCPICAFGYVGMDLASHYGISDGMFPIKGCLPVLSLYQIFGTVLEREKLHITMAAVEADAA